MRLYSTGLSAFATRVRAAIYAKGLDIEIVPPPATGTKSAAYLAMNPMGKIPVLLLDNGVAIPESETIIEYLEDAFPEKPLRPATPEGRAKARLISRVAELYIMTNISILFGQIDPKARNQVAVDAAVANIRTGLSYLNAVMDEGPHATGKVFTTADCWLIPQFLLLQKMQSVFGLGDLLAAEPKVRAYAEAIDRDPLAQRLAAEQEADAAARRAAAPA